MTCAETAAAASTFNAMHRTRLRRNGKVTIASLELFAAGKARRKVGQSFVGTVPL
jgi:hypothetical protein